METGTTLARPGSLGKKQAMSPSLLALEPRFFNSWAGSVSYSLLSNSSSKPIFPVVFPGSFLPPRHFPCLIPGLFTGCGAESLEPQSPSFLKELMLRTTRDNSLPLLQIPKYPRVLNLKVWLGSLPCPSLWTGAWCLVFSCPPLGTHKPTSEVNE